MSSSPRSFSLSTERDPLLIKWYDKMKAEGKASEEIRKAIRHYMAGPQQSPLSPEAIVEKHMVELRTRLAEVSTTLDELTQQIARDGLHFSPDLSAKVQALTDETAWEEPDDIADALDGLVRG